MIDLIKLINLIDLIIDLIQKGGDGHPPPSLERRWPPAPLEGRWPPSSNDRWIKSIKLIKLIELIELIKFN